MSTALFTRSLLLGLVSLAPRLAGADLLPAHADAEVGLASALRLHGDDPVTQKAVYFKANLEDNWDSGYYKAKGRVRYDARYDGHNPYSQEARDDYRFSADWRHLYWGHYLGDGEVTVGWQQVVWGRADELRVLDQVNPIDYREGVTALLEDSRIAVPMVRLTQPVGEWEVEALWITDFLKNQAPAQGSEFDAPLFAVPDPDLFVIDSKPDYSGQKGFSYGMSANGRIGSVDASFVALNARQQDPVYAVEGIADDQRVLLERQFPRYSMGGAGLAIDAGHSFVVRSEVAYFDRWHVTNPYRTHGSSQSPMVKSLLGVDYLLRNWLISVQWQEQQLLDWQMGMVQDKRQPLFTLSAEGNHLRDRLKSRLVLAMSPPAKDDALLQGIFTYTPVDWLKLGLEVDVFFGKEDRTFGQYRQRDQLRVSAGYLF
ncbi:DUF1302 family protein [Pseudomonas fluorescens]|uniref:Uncharacterized protein n=1 Tax=Pseudomonas fluorescens TaxID=294 RepID=A0A7Z6MW99_PSEFL|nr:DUF1302 family protein [Pseudomonas fluorescens]RDS90188.1 hypothetical protein DL347_15405 [Pseudomonas fluorescens]